MAVKKTTTKQASLDGDPAKAKTTPAKPKAGAKAKAATAKAKVAVARPKAVASKRAKTTAAKKAPASTTKATSARPQGTTRRGAASEAVSGDREQREQIERTAYLKAEADGFSGDPVQYWFAAEAEVLASRPKRRK